MARTKTKPTEYDASAAPAPAIPTGQVTTLPLSSLILSGLNVRQTERDADIGALAEDIAARGLKQNLVVIPAHFITGEFTTGQVKGNWADKFEVIAGGRRFQAMSLLVADGRLPADHPVPVLIEDRDEARETSLSENLHRVAMNPADEFEAFAQIAAEWTMRNAPAVWGAGERSTPEAVAYTAKRFGVTQRHVEGRLRLAALAPEILEALRAGTINLDSAKAYAGSADHDLQLKVFAAQAKQNWKQHDPAEVRRALRGITLPLDHALVIYAGLDAYRAAGGRTEVEMFMGTDGEERLVNVSLVEQLARTRAEAELPALIAAEGWQSGIIAKGVGHYANWPKVPDGYSRCWDYAKQLNELPAETRANCIAVVSISNDGTGLFTMGRFKAEVAPKAEPSRYQPETDEERTARERQNLVDLWAARLAVGPFAGTRLEGCAFWPSSGWRGDWVQFEWPQDDEAFESEEDVLPVAAMVKINIRVTAEQMDAVRAQAEAKADEIIAEAKAAVAVKAAMAVEATAEDDDEREPDDESEFEEDDA